MSVYAIISFREALSLLKLAGIEQSLQYNIIFMDFESCEIEYTLMSLATAMA